MKKQGFNWIGNTENTGSNASGTLDTNKYQETPASMTEILKKILSDLIKTMGGAVIQRRRMFLGPPAVSLG